MIYTIKCVLLLIVVATTTADASESMIIDNTGIVMMRGNTNEMSSEALVHRSLTPSFSWSNMLCKFILNKCLNKFIAVLLLLLFLISTVYVH